MPASGLCAQTPLNSKAPGKLAPKAICWGPQASKIRQVSYTRNPIPQPITLANSPNSQ